MHKVLRGAVVLIAVVLAVQGLMALATTDSFMATYTMVPGTTKATAEVRCFFGGNFLAWGIVIALGLFRPELRRGGYTAVAIALGVIAAARVPSMVLDGQLAFNAGAMVAEAVIAVVLLVAARPREA